MLSATALAALIKAKLTANPATGFTPDHAGADPFCAAIAEAVVEHILAAAVATVPPGVAVSVAVVGAAGTGATTAPGVGGIT